MFRRGGVRGGKRCYADCGRHAWTTDLRAGEGS